MHHHVAAFIENNIDAIENNDWKFIFETWYEEVYEVSVEAEAEIFADFMTALEQSGLATLSTTVKERSNVIAHYLEKIIQDKEYATMYSWESVVVPYEELFNSLYSWLGFTEHELSDILDTLQDSTWKTDKQKRVFTIEN